MTQRSYFWGGTTVGDATLAPYDDDEYSDIQRKMFVTDRAFQGVIINLHSDLLVTNPAGTTIRMNMGGAIVDGKFYEADADVDFTVVVPGAGSNYYNLVLRKDWAAQTVRAALLGPDVGSPPSVTQSDGATWEISIATVRVQSGGTITITDARDYCTFKQVSNTANIKDEAITLEKLHPSLRWVLLESDTIAADGDEIDWNGISEEYSQLKIVVRARATANGGGLVDAGLRLIFNGDTGANYESFDKETGADGDRDWLSGVRNYMRLIGGVPPGNMTSGRFGMADILIGNYSSTAMRKYAQWHNSCESVSLFSQFTGFGFWTSLSAISRIQITSGSSVTSTNFGFEIGSEFRLYGIP